MKILGHIIKDAHEDKTETYYMDSFYEKIPALQEKQITYYYF